MVSESYQVRYGTCLSQNNVVSLILVASNAQETYNRLAVHDNHTKAKDSPERPPTLTRDRMILFRTLSIVATVLLTLSLSALGNAQASEPSDASQTQPTSGEVPFSWQGQQLTFDISALGGTVARCAMNTGYTGIDSNLGEIVPLRGFCVTLGLMSAFLNFNYEGIVFANPETLEPIWGEKLLEDRGRSRTYETFYNREQLVAVVERREPQRDSQRQYRDWVPAQVYDILTWLQHVRTRDLSVGNEFVYYLYDGWKLRRVTMRVVRHVDFYLNDANPAVRAAELDVDAETLDSYPAAPWIPFGVNVPPVFIARPDDSTKVGEAWFSLGDDRTPLGLNLGTPFGKMRLRVREMP